MSVRRPWPVLIVGALGLALLAVPVAFQNKSRSPSRNVDVLFLDHFSFSMLRHAYPDADAMNALVLAVGCGLALMAALAVWEGLAGSSRSRRFFMVSAVLLAALAVEESFEITEAVAAAVGMNPRRTDLLLPVVGVAFVLAYRKVLVRSRPAVWIGGAGALIFVAAIVSDSLVGVSRTEDPLESLSSLLLVTAFAVLALELLRERKEVAT